MLFGRKIGERIGSGRFTYNDIIPAKRLGMKTVWVRQGYAVYQSIDDESKRPDYIVDSIEELRELGEKFFENN